MKLVYTIDTNSFEPISFGSNYLYNQYDKVNSFIFSNFGDEFKNLLAKPILTAGTVQWYSNLEFPLSRLVDLSSDTQQTIKGEYWNVKSKLDLKVSNLIASSDKEKKSWGKLLQEVFNDENNIILSDGVHWCLLWGWKFRNKTENYLAPSFLKKTVPIAEKPPISNQTPVSDNSHNEVQNPESATNGNEYNMGFQQKRTRSNSDFLYRIKRYLRNFVYHYWGLMLLIMLLLMYSCLLRSCKNDAWKKEAMLKSKLEQLEKKVKEKCKN